MLTIISVFILLTGDGAGGDEKIMVGEHERVFQLANSVHQRFINPFTAPIQQ